VGKVLEALGPNRVFDLGCGNGSLLSLLSERYEVAGIDASESGVAHANASYPNIRIERASVYDDLASRFGSYDVVVSLEVVEHLYDPRKFAARLFELVRPGGTAIVSTPYHGYLKNLALALSGKLDDHFTALWDGGHIKFWSVRTLTKLLSEAGFELQGFRFAGRFPGFAKSMIAIVRRPIGVAPPPSHTDRVGR
jgi:2-polyprenyl-6-hydroxyphenyl methylase/3-demethylubiquinone-9 3-methyltransferase